MFALEGAAADFYELENDIVSVQVTPFVETSDDPVITVDEVSSTPTMGQGSLSCPGQGMYFFEAVPKGVVPMSANTAAADAAQWHTAWDAAYLAEHEVGGTSSSMNDEVLMSYYS